MNKIGILMAEGFEESETMIVADMLRRLDCEVTTYSTTQYLYVKGMQKMVLKADKLLDSSINECNCLFIPGGRPGVDNLKNDVRVISLIKDFNDQKKYIAAMCSGTLLLEETDIIKGRKVTGYHGYKDRLLSGQFTHEVAVHDENLITSVGPATSYPMAFKIAEVLGKDPSILKEKILYNFAGGK